MARQGRKAACGRNFLNSSSDPFLAGHLRARLIGGLRTRPSRLASGATHTLVRAPATESRNDRIDRSETVAATFAHHSRCHPAPPFAKRTVENVHALDAQRDLWISRRMVYLVGITGRMVDLAEKA